MILYCKTREIWSKQKTWFLLSGHQFQIIQQTRLYLDLESMTICQYRLMYSWKESYHNVQHTDGVHCTLQMKWNYKEMIWGRLYWRTHTMILIPDKLDVCAHWSISAESLSVTYTWPREGLNSQLLHLQNSQGYTLADAHYCDKGGGLPDAPDLVVTNEHETTTLSTVLLFPKWPLLPLTKTSLFE